MRRGTIDGCTTLIGAVTWQYLCMTPSRGVAVSVCDRDGCPTLFRGVGVSVCDWEGLGLVTEIEAGADEVWQLCNDSPMLSLSQFDQCAFQISCGQSQLVCPVYFSVFWWSVSAHLSSVRIRCLSCGQSQRTSVINRCLVVGFKSLEPRCDPETQDVWPWPWQSRRKHRPDDCKLAFAVQHHWQSFQRSTVEESPEHMRSVHPAGLSYFASIIQGDVQYSHWCDLSHPDGRKWAEAGVPLFELKLVEFDPTTTSKNISFHSCKLPHSSSRHWYHHIKRQTSKKPLIFCVPNFGYSVLYLKALNSLMSLACSSLDISIPSLFPALLPPL